MERDIANVISYVRKNAGLSRSKLAALIDVSERTIANWENGVSKPDADHFLDVFYACNQHLISVMRTMNSEQMFGGDISPEEIRQRLIAMIRSETTDEMNRELLYNLSADHGSDAAAQLHMCTAYNHLPREDRYDICGTVIDRYELRKDQGRLIRTEYAVKPDIEYLKFERSRVREEITK